MTNNRIAVADAVEAIDNAKTLEEAIALTGMIDSIYKPKDIQLQYVLAKVGGRGLGEHLSTEADNVKASFRRVWTEQKKATECARNAWTDGGRTDSDFSSCYRGQWRSLWTYAEDFARNVGITNSWTIAELLTVSWDKWAVDNLTDHIVIDAPESVGGGVFVFRLSN